jgi:hypothetical protein
MPSGGVNMKRTGITALMMAVSFPVVEKIRLIEDNTKCCHLKNVSVKGLYLSEAQNPIPPPPPCTL